MFSKGPASADPFPQMSVEGKSEKGSVKKKCLEPVWLERFELPCEDPDSVFSFEVMDHDNFGAADFMGCCLCGNQVQASFIGRVYQRDVVSEFEPRCRDRETRPLSLGEKRGTSS